MNAEAGIGNSDSNVTGSPEANRRARNQAQTPSQRTPIITKRNITPDFISTSDKCKRCRYDALAKCVRTKYLMLQNYKKYVIYPNRPAAPAAFRRAEFLQDESRWPQLTQPPYSKSIKKATAQ